MNKLQLEFLRLIIAFLVFIFIVTNLFMYVNSVTLDWFEALAEVITIPILILSIIIPIWMIIDLIRKKVADKSIFNLTFFISIISVLLFLFAIIFLG